MVIFSFFIVRRSGNPGRKGLKYSSQNLRKSQCSLTADTVSIQYRDQKSRYFSISCPTSSSFSEIYRDFWEVNHIQIA